MTDKLSREDVLRIAVETGFIRGPEVEGIWLASFERFAAAMYAAGAEGMRLQMQPHQMGSDGLPITTNTEGEQ